MTKQITKQEAAAARKELNDFIKSYGFKHRDVHPIKKAVLAIIADRELFGKALAHAAKGEQITDEQLEELQGLHGILNGDIPDEASPLYDDKGNLIREPSHEWFEFKERYDVLDALYYAGEILYALEKAQWKRERSAEYKAWREANMA